MKNRLIYLCLLTCSFLSVQAQTLTLDDCKRMAKENNYLLKNKALEVDAADQTRKEAFTKYFPTIDAKGMYMNLNKGLVQFETLNPATGKPMEISMLKNGKAGALSAMQPVFAGGQIINGNKLAVVGKKVAGLQMKQVEDEIENRTEQYFWQIVQLKSKLLTINSMETLLKSIRKDVELFIKAGLTTRNDLLRVELKENELASKKLTVENGINVSKLLLAQYIGLKDNHFELNSIDFTDSPSPMQYYVDSKQAVLSRPESGLLDCNVEANRLQKKMEIGKRLPSVGVGASYFYNDFLDKDYNAAALVATVSIPISDWWGGSHSIKKQTIKQKQAENDKKNNMELMVVQIEKTWSDVQEAYKQIQLAKSSVTSAEENMRMNQDFLKAGTSTLTDVLDAQSLLQKSKDQLTDAQANYRLMLTKYLIITGR